MYNHLTLQMYDPTLTASEAMPATWGYANCNRLRGQSEWFAMMFRDF